MRREARKLLDAGPIMAGVLMIGILYGTSFFLTGWVYYLVFFLVAVSTEFLSRILFKRGFLPIIFPFKILQKTAQ